MSEVKATNRTARIKALFEEAALNFREYLQIRSVHPDVNYDECISFLRKQAASIGLPITVIQVAPKKPIAIITWEGTEPELPSILLNSHMDVVPVFEEKWSYPPFSAYVDEEGLIYARGAQDMKSVGIQYLESIRFLKEDGMRLKRSIHVSFVPDEEIGSQEGMAKFVETSVFKNLNVGFAMDEGSPCGRDEYYLYYGEKSVWQPKIHIPGQVGHGSLLLEDTAGEKLSRFLNKVYHFRQSEMKRMKEHSTLSMSDITTINVTQVNGGNQPNVLPHAITVVLDCRTPVTVDPGKLEETVAGWCREVSYDITIQHLQRQPQWSITSLDATNIYWVAFKQATDSLGLKIKPEICPGFTDARFIRALGLPAFGFSPMNLTANRVHDNNEYLTVDTFIKGIKIYNRILTIIGNLDEQ